MLYLDGAGGDGEADVLVVLCRLIGGQVEGALGRGIGVAVPATPALGGRPRGLEVRRLWRLLLWLLRSLGGLRLRLRLSLRLGLRLRLRLGHCRRRRRRLHLLLEIRRVVFAHVLHQVRFLRGMEEGLREGREGRKLPVTSTLGCYLEQNEAHTEVLWSQPGSPREPLSVLTPGGQGGGPLG